MKHSRHKKILEIISTSDVATQDELGEMLRTAGYKVTQATVSRDIKELGLVKSNADNGFRYAVLSDGVNISPVSNRQLLGRSVTRVDAAGNLAVLTCRNDMGAVGAQAVKALKFQNVVGVVSDNGTVLVVCKSEEDCRAFAGEIHIIISSYTE